MELTRGVAVVIAIVVVVAVVTITVAIMATELDPRAIQRRDRLAMEPERDAGQNDILEVERVLDRPDQEAGVVTVRLELADEARVSRQLTAATTTPTGHIHDRDVGARGARAAFAVVAEERHHVVSGLRGAGRPRERCRVVAVIGERRSLGQ